MGEREAPGAQRSGTRRPAERKEQGGDRGEYRPVELGCQQRAETDSEGGRPCGRRAVEQAPIGERGEGKDKGGYDVGRRQGAVRYDNRIEAVQRQRQETGAKAVQPARGGEQDPAQDDGGG